MRQQVWSSAVSHLHSAPRPGTAQVRKCFPSTLSASPAVGSVNTVVAEMGRGGLTGLSSS